MADNSKRLEKADKLLQKGKADAALDEYLAILEDEPKNDKVRQTAADLCLAVGRNREGSALLSRLFEQEIDSGEIHKGIVTYKKLAKISKPTPLQTFHYGQLVEKKDKKEALEAYQTALEGFEAQRKDKQAVAAAKAIVDLAPTPKNLQRAAEKCAFLGESAAGALFFLQLGLIKEQDAPGSGFEWFEKAYGLDPANLQAVLLYARGLFAHNALTDCIAVLEPAASGPISTLELRELYARSLMAAKRPAEAEPFAWELFEKDPNQLADIVSLVGAYLDIGQAQRALDLAGRLDEHETNAGRRREFISCLHEMSEKRMPAMEFLEYLVTLFSTANRELEYSGTLLKLFQLYVAAGKYKKAGETLDRAAEVDPYEPGHAKRLEMLQGKIDQHQYNTIANRFQKAASAATEAGPVPASISTSEGSAAAESEPTVLEDFILQAEIYLQYGMRSKAMERLERISKLFPGEENRNEKLRQLYVSAGFSSKSAGAAPAAGAPGKAAKSAAQKSAPPESSSPSLNEENAVDNFSRVTEITRNIYRQANVKSVLFTAVNEIGRHFNASRCVAGLCTPGRPPSAALEYCATGVKQSDVIAIVKLIGAAQQLAANGVVAIPATAEARELDSVREHIRALKIESLLAVPLMDAGEQSGIVILEQCAPRQWRQTDIVVLKTIADQTVLAVANARLRSLMKTLAVTDEKSGLLKRSSYLDVLNSEVRRSTQQQTPLTIMLLHFGKASALVKEVGEGPLENMMQQIGQTLCSHLRQNDVAVRYDITTIALLLSDTNEKNGFLVVDKMRKVLVSTKIPGTDRTPPMSVGIAEVVLQSKFDPVDVVTEVINRVESALEQARSEGGNKAHSLAANLQPTLA